MTIATLTNEQIRTRIEALNNAAGNSMTSTFSLDARVFEELLEHREAAAEPVYQCQFFHTDEAGSLQWHWEDVNKEFYEQWDSERKGSRRTLYATPNDRMLVLPEALSWEERGYQKEVIEALVTAGIKFREGD